MKKIYALAFLYLFISPLQADDTKTQQAIDWIMKSCISGGSRVSVSGQGEASLKFKSILSSGLSGEVTLNYDELEGLGDELNKVSMEHADKVRQCIEPYRMKIFNTIMGMPDTSESQQENINELNKWEKGGRSKENYTIGLDENVFHTSSPSYYIKSASNELDNKKNGTFVKKVDINFYKGKRVKITAYVKSIYPDKKGNTSYFYLSGHNEKEAYKHISNKTNWNKVNYVVDIPETASYFEYGLSLWGAGKIWIDDVTFQVVDKNTSLDY